MNSHVLLKYLTEHHEYLVPDSRKRFVPFICEAKKGTGELVKTCTLQYVTNLFFLYTCTVQYTNLHDPTFYILQTFCPFSLISLK